VDISDKEIIDILENRRVLDQAVIKAMQDKLNSNPIKSLFWRKPWKSNICLVKGDTFIITIQNLVSFIKYAHDCQDPAIGCSCTDSFRFPRKG